jgi:hypothetical protein
MAPLCYMICYFNITDNFPGDYQPLQATGTRQAGGVQDRRPAADRPWAGDSVHWGHHRLLQRGECTTAAAVAVAGVGVGSR